MPTAATRGRRRDTRTCSRVRVPQVRGQQRQAPFDLEAIPVPADQAANGECVAEVMEPGGRLRSGDASPHGTTAVAPSAWTVRGPWQLPLRSPGDSSAGPFAAADRSTLAPEHGNHGLCDHRHPAHPVEADRHQIRLREQRAEFRDREVAEVPAFPEGIEVPVKPTRRDHE